MFDVWSAVRWWDEWQLRILVLGSLGLQWFMLVAAPMRKYTIPQFVRTLTWVAYISSDAVAIYALATLFNRHAKASSGVSCSDGNGGKAGVLEILWAPLLLVHLGGQREMTAYTIEDNELWTRHTVTLVSQVAVAVYAFYKSWPDTADTKLWATAVLLYVFGVFSFCEKPWAFYRARIHRLEVVSTRIQGTRRQHRWCFCFNELDEEDINMIVRCRFCRWKKKMTRGKNDTATEPQLLDQLRSVRNKVHMILSDLSLYAAAADWKSRFASKLTVRQILGRTIGADQFARRWLANAFGLIYTRLNVVWTPAYLAYHLLLVPALNVAAITLFAVGHKRGVYNPADVKTTYILLSFTAALDFFGVFFAELLHWVMAERAVPSLCEWIAQHNLIDAALRKKRRPFIGGLIINCNLERYFLSDRDNKLFNKVAGYLIIDLLYLNDRENRRESGIDLSTYRNLEPKATNWALADKDLRAAAHEKTMVKDTLGGAFDRCVVVWHIATDLCFCRKPPPRPMNPREVRTEAISNYMSYLLNFHPEMLLTGSRRHLFTEAMDNIQGILPPPDKIPTSGRHFKHQDENELADCIFRHADVIELVIEKADNDSRPKYPLVHDACTLAKQLLELKDEWRLELMYRVWLGMLFYSATMCRGYLHAKSLGEGGEFLSFVWLLLSTTGFKTLADKLQMPPDSDDQTRTKDADSDDRTQTKDADSDEEYNRYEVRDEDVI